MVDAHKEHRKGNEYSIGAKRKIRREAGFVCAGCGEEIRARRTHANPNIRMLEVHHEMPISKGGDKATTPWPLCGPRRCHQIADDLIVQHSIPFGQVVEKLGPYPFQPYVPAMEQGNFGKAERKIMRRLDRTN